MTPKGFRAALWFLGIWGISGIVVPPPYSPDRAYPIRADNRTLVVTDDPTVQSG